MGERKVLNKYFPPDFDPALLPKRKRPKDGQIKVRVMLPFTCQCNTCGEFIYRGRKFTSRQEFAPEKYLTISIFRFYIKCPSCCAEITFKTDPEHADYICEQGATRHFEPYKQNDARLEFFKKDEDKEDVDDPMKTLENRTKASKREMDILDALEEIRDMNSRHARLDTETVIAHKLGLIFERENAEDDAEIDEVFNPNQVLKRLDDDDEEEETNYDQELNKEEVIKTLPKEGYEEESLSEKAVVKNEETADESKKEPLIKLEESAQQQQSSDQQAPAVLMGGNLQIKVKIKKDKSKKKRKHKDGEPKKQKHKKKKKEKENVEKNTI